VEFEPELALERVEHRLDPLPDPAEVAVTGAFVAPVWAQHPHPSTATWLSIARPARP
jgi:hypothetical protein